MVLEYLIGTSACACALSACFDAISDGAVTKKLTESIGSYWGHPPDVLAFCITLAMMTVLVAGVQKSVIFNNVLNAINFSVWIFIMVAGLFYVDLSNWNDYGGFLPMGWSGVMKGSATCFYAFIGFDIIATTGEEANNPKKSIPFAIVGSLVIILVAYVSSSAILTLVVPYDEIVKDSGLVEMFGQVGAPRCQYIVAIGALAGLTVSMFGSMFPMPRIVYAMAKDGLIFQWLAEIWNVTGTPAAATFVLGLMAACASLIIQLEVLVEMMSIGTLLAYTLVSTCVLLLRYQPTSTTLIDLLPESMRSPMPGTPMAGSPLGGTTPTKDYGSSMFPQTPTGGQPQQSSDAFRSSTYPNGPQAAAQRLSLSLGIGTNLLGTNPPPTVGGPVLVRKVTRTSPDSDDTDTLGDTEADDAFLMADRNESRYYGSVHSSNTPRMSRWETQMRVLQYLCPKLLPWMEPGPCTEDTGRLVTKLVGILFLQIVVFDLLLVATVGSEGFGASLGYFLILVLFVGIILCLLLISRKPQNNKKLLFMTPGLPFVPAIAVTVNFYLILKLSILTLVRFTIWMTLGLVMYFKYGIKNSTLEIHEDPAVELTVARSPSREAGTGMRTTSLSTHK
ncbi:putative cationic amino acid transporter [Orchesella cincta]|uniref:Putative cationic amino acid transporter n=1 Tax=Orchesella cincta TaxID=48709 RepID=A0A1D2ML99_ORCCI|nr:putative cationic amino acid transporter [Orchesella cincta]